MEVIQKSGSRLSESLDFVLATSNPDRVHDVIVVPGIRTKSFESNPVALYMHRHDEAVGTWTNLRRNGDSLIGTLILAEAGTSKLVDFARSMIEQSIIKATSVSVQPIRSTPNAGGKGRTIHESDLVEVSLVTVPMNPQALLLAKSFDFTEAEINQILGPPAPVKCDPNRKTIAILKARMGLYR